MHGYNDELYHWGIKGMKWGVRRYQNKDGTLTAAGRSRYVGSNAEGTDEKSQKRVGLSDKQKRALKIGAALAVAALGTYGGYHLAKSGKLEPFVAAGKQKAAELMEEAGKERSSTPKTHAHSDYTRAHEKKSVRVLSDEELNAKINRLQKEKQYESLIATPSNVKKMLATAGTAASALGTISTLYNNYNAVAKIGKNLIASKKIQNRMSTMNVHSE
ncbi:hypothetical protein [Faecalibacterium sp. AF10-46]|jgi:hypothetical protein|uniref:DUF7211 domain-containing protein n=1 Tax=Faecalibacterium sp. AF10-46 TaxID=2302955 RepID=UPI000E762EB6|nr:hypothetical protein [Faecalibacterium sp. AF10-46]RJW80292.1 hypothetical protein DWV57_03105 [Faecalibacterium sp. AF10-46]